MNMREQFKRVPNNHLIKKLNICNIPLSESEEYDIYMAYLVLNCILNKSFFPWSKTILTLYTLSKLLGFIIIIINYFTPFFSSKFLVLDFQSNV